MTGFFNILHYSYFTNQKFLFKYQTFRWLYSHPHCCATDEDGCIAIETFGIKIKTFDW